VSRGDRFQQGRTALAQFVERERHANVRRPHKEPLEAMEASPGGEEHQTTPHRINLKVRAWVTTAS
jgi:hypothetical protein